MPEQLRDGNNSLVKLGFLWQSFILVWLFLWRNKNRFGIFLSLKKVAAMYFHAHDVNSISWSSCCRPIQTSPAKNFSQKKRLFEDIWRCKEVGFGWILVVRLHEHFLYCFVSHSPSKKVSQAVVTERSASTCGRNAEVLTSKMKSWEKVEHSIPF